MIACPRTLAVFAALLLGLPHGAVAASKKSSLVERHLIDFDTMKQRRIVRVIVPFSKTIYFVDKGRQYGTAVSFGLELEKYLNRNTKKEIDHIHIVFIPTPRESLFAALNEGLGDIVMANLTVTEDRLRDVEFTDPVYTHASEILVAAPGSPPVASIDDLAGNRSPYECPAATTAICLRQTGG